MCTIAFWSFIEAIELFNAKFDINRTSDHVKLTLYILNWHLNLFLSYGRDFENHCSGHSWGFHRCRTRFYHLFFFFFKVYLQNWSLSHLLLAFVNTTREFNPTEHSLDALYHNIWRRYDPRSVNSQQPHQNLLQDREHIQQLHFHRVTGSVSETPSSSGCQRSSHDMLTDCRNPSLLCSCIYCCFYIEEISILGLRIS